MKTRLDVALVERGFFQSREKAKTHILVGNVYVNNQKADKVGMTVQSDDKIEVRGEQLKYVSRGGLKLEKAINEFHICLQDKICMDIGASTGGFTDCMLQNGAKLVYAVDVGYGQLAWKLRNHPQVINFERTNIRYFTPDKIDTLLDFASIDVSFISLKLVLPVAYQLLKPNGEIVCLIKPQFEAGRENVGKKGVVRDQKIHALVIHNIVNFVLAHEFQILNLSYSPIKGPEGNIEYLLHLKKSTQQTSFDETIIEEIVLLSHDKLQ